jgi:zinc protease
MKRLSRVVTGPPTRHPCCGTSGAGTPRVTRCHAPQSSLRTVVVVVAVAGLLLSSAVAAQQARSWPSERPPRPLSPRPVNFPPYEVRTLPNGLQIVVVPHHEQPAVSIRLLIQSGSAYDPPGKSGVANLMASLLDQGTTTRSAAQIADTIDYIGGALSTGAGTDLTFLNAIVMKDSFPVGLDLLSDIARNPAFDPAEIERQRQQALSNLQVNYEDPDYIASTVFDRLVYGFHPYGMPTGGTPETFRQISRDDIREFHRRYFAPNNALMAIVGDVTTQEAFTAAERVFVKWERHPIEVPVFSEPPKPTRRVIVIDKPDAVQTEIRAGHLGIQRKHRDYMSVNLAIKILGGEGANRLYRVLRTDRGLTYGASADMEAFRDAGDFVAETDTRSEATGDVLRLMVEQFFQLQREQPGDRELQDAQAYLTGSFPLTIETPDSIATHVLNALVYGLSLDELQTYRDRVNAVNAEDVYRVARYYLQPDRLSVVIVGNASAFREQLPRAGFDRYEVIPLSDLDLSAADFKRRAAQPRAGQP